VNDQPNTDKTSLPEIIAGRYRIEECLGKGGMGAVYRVFDGVTDSKVALKLLSEKASQSQTISSLFEREFYTLAQLAHPGIVEVYDFGVDEAGAYYTMELLDGEDFRKMAPLHWKKACTLLRDVASALALLHSRRLLHRDLSTRNVLCTSDGKAKLIDFGVMAPFGAHSKLIGTPRFVSPEAYNYQPLDQRSDLYSLGTLAYWLMTGKHAYQARHLAQLPDAWRSQPQSLSVVNPDIPRMLSDLIMSLLHLDRMARPFCAAEVVETLSAVAGLDLDDTVDMVQAYLTTPSLCGRDDLVITIRKHMLCTVGGCGGNTLLFGGPSGIGRSRLLAELVLEGKVVVLPY